MEDGSRYLKKTGRVERIKRKQRKKRVKSTKGGKLDIELRV